MIHSPFCPNVRSTFDESGNRHAFDSRRTQDGLCRWERVRGMLLRGEAA
jgi:hypothetical protein